jgi:hypothetical protein
MPASADVHEDPLPLAPVTRCRLPVLAALGFATFVTVTGCAQQREPGYYDPPPASTVTDAQYMGAGADYRPVVRAPSQLQIDLKPSTPSQQQRAAQQQARAQQEGHTSEDGQAIPAADLQGDDKPANPAPAPAPQSKLVPQPQTYMGTLPCFAAGMNCVAQRITLTLAPNGRWRGRSAYLDNAPDAGKPVAEQGCWEASDEKPPRVFLTGTDGASRAEFVLAANNVLRLRAISGVTPNLNYTLTRQPDLDPIDELSKQPPPKCQ